MKLYRREYSCMYKVRRVNPMDNYFVIGRPGKLRPTPVVGAERRVRVPPAPARARVGSKCVRGRHDEVGR